MPKPFFCLKGSSSSVILVCMAGQHVQFVIACKIQHRHVRPMHGSRFVTGTTRVPKMLSPEPKRVVTGSSMFTISCVFALQVEICGKIREKSWVPETLTRKLVHMAVGSSMLTGLCLFPIGHSWPGRLGVCAFLCGFMSAFAITAYMPDDVREKLPKIIGKRIDRLVGLCRGGNRMELMGGTFLYCVMAAQMVMVHYTSPISVIALR